MTVIKRSSTDFQKPSRVELDPRADSSSSESQGCVVCPTPTPPGPTCKKGEEQLLRTQTCDKCPEYYCSPIDGDGGSGAPIGPIVGGTVGGVVALIVAGLLYYFLVWKKKHPSLDDDADLALSDLENEQDDKGSLSNESNLNDSSVSPNNISSGGVSGNTSRNTSGSVDNLRNSTTGLEKPPTRRTKSNTNANRRLSSYESFTRPQTRYKGNNRSNKRQSRRPGQRQLKSQNLVQSPYMDPNSNNRNSMATTISTTNASNILPIAYIPGVTVRPTKNNTKSIYSYETDSIFSDLNTIENASIIGDIMRANNYNGQDPQSQVQQNQAQQGQIVQLQSNGQGAPNDDNQDNTMTAIKGQPRLVNVDRIDEEDEDEYEMSDLESNTYSVKNNISGELSKNNRTVTTTNYLNDSTLSNITGDIQEEEESDDSDVDSDIGEIQRATSIRRTDANQVKQVKSEPEVLIDNNNQGTRDQKEIPIDLIDLGKPLKNDDHSINGSNNGSFVLDVEIDNQRPESQASGEKSPFEDP